MNIFILAASEDWATHMKYQAQFHCSAHVIKMIAEQTQMIVTALHVTPDIFGASTARLALAKAPCKPMHTAGHVRHPCTLWTCQSHENLMYLIDMSLALCDEHQYRYPNSKRHVYGTFLDHAREVLFARFEQPVLPATFARAIKGRPDLQGVRVPHLEVVDSYRDYYVQDKARFAKWGPRDVPSWFRTRLAALQLVTT